MYQDNAQTVQACSHAPYVPESHSGKDYSETFLKIGRLFSHPLITTVVSVVSSVAIYVLLHWMFSKPFIGFELTLPVIIPTLVAYPISRMFQFFTQELERSNRSLSHANKEIASQKKELEELNKVKLKLFSIIAHDLRSPMALLYSYLEYLQEEGLDPENVGRMMPAIAEQVQSTLQLMDNLLKWSKGQMNGISPTMTDIDLDIENTRHLTVLADQDMLRLVLRNLTANAIKFTPQNGNIRINAQDDASHVYITVQDSGVGISEQDQQKLFRTDVSHSTPGTNNEKGTGLGLLLCKQFIEKHHGEINVTSEAGQGSRFSISLPKRETTQSAP